MCHKNTKLTNGSLGIFIRLKHIYINVHHRWKAIKSTLAQELQNPVVE